MIRPAGARPLFLVLGILLLLGALVTAANTVLFLHSAVRTEGSVEDPGPGGVHATVVFHLPSGRALHLIPGFVFTPVQSGQRVPVVYDADSPVDSATLDWFGSLWAPTIIMVWIGSGMLAVYAFDRPR